MRDKAVPVRWWIATDRNFRRSAQHGTAFATADLAHSIHIDVQGLEPATEYWYRFAVGGVESTLGKTRTLPSNSAKVERVRFTTCSCQHFEQGYFNAYQHMIEDAPDFVVHLGDYIYDVSFGSSVRTHDDNSPLTTLTDYRRRHSLYKSDKCLQEAHRQLPFYFIPDNHDALVDNNAERLAIRAAAYQAWYEHLPIRTNLRPGSAALALYQSFDIGDLARINLLDTRQFRAVERISEGDPDYGFGNYRPDVKERSDLSRSMLGTEQTHWLSRQLTEKPAKWNVVASTVPFGEFVLRRSGDPTPHYYYASWDGYPANRDLVVSSLQEIKNPVVLSGDIHSFWAKDIVSATDAEGSSVATEFVTSAISSGWPKPLSEPIDKNLSNNPTVRLYDAEHRGYCLHDVTQKYWQTRMRGLDTVSSRSSKIKDVAKFRIAHGQTGAERI